MFGSKEYDGYDKTHHWAALVPEKLYDRKEALSGLSQSVSSQSGNQNMDETYTVEFSGGGGLMTMTLNHEHAKQHASMLGGTNHNYNTDNSFKLTVPMEFEGGMAWGQYDFNLEAKINVEEAYYLETNRQGSTEISMVLGDGDSDDHFVSILVGHGTVPLLLHFFTPNASIDFYRLSTHTLILGMVPFFSRRPVGCPCAFTRLARCLQPWPQ